jgi:hypothetical protein
MRVMCRGWRVSVARETAYLKSVPLPECIEPSISIMDLIISGAESFDRFGPRHPRESGDLDSCFRRNDEESQLLISTTCLTPML